MKRSIKITIATILVLLTLALPMTGALAAIFDGTAVEGAFGYMMAVAPVNVRMGPGLSYTVLGWLDYGDIVWRTGIINLYGNSWTQIDFMGAEAYVSSSYLTAYSPYPTTNPWPYPYPTYAPYPVPTTIPVPTTVPVPTTLPVPTTAPSGAYTYLYATTALNVRTGPGTKYPRITWINYNQIVQQIGKSGNWAYIKLGDGTIGYASLKYLKPYGTFTQPIDINKQTNKPVTDPTYGVTSQESAVAAYIRRYRNATSGPEAYQYLWQLDKFYTLNARNDYSMRSYQFVENSYVKYVYSSSRYAGDITFYWYRSGNGKAALADRFPPELVATNPRYYGYTFNHNGVDYYYKSYSANYIEVWWTEANYLLCAYVPANLSLSDIGSICRVRCIRV